MERIVEFTPAFDRRHPDPNKNYGIYGVELRMLLKGKKGAVQFVLYTNWMLPGIPKPDPENAWMRDPIPVDLGYHSYEPRYEGHVALKESCPYLGGKPCYYDGSSLNAKPVFERLLCEGHEGVWNALADYYRHTFGEEE